MELIVLKMPPDQVALLADAVAFCLEDGKYTDRERDLNHLLVWLRYRHGKWLAAQSVAKASEQENPPGTSR